MIVYLTNRWQTRGIVEAEGKEDPRWPENVWVIEERYFGSDWHRTREEAVRYCEERREAEIKALEGRIEKLRAMRF